MRLLAIETSGAACSVAAWDADAPPLAARLRGHRCLELGRGHAEALLPMAVEVLDLAGWRFADLDVLAVNRGPGGFTGVRVGVAAARALALAAGLPVVGVTGLETLAALAAAESPPGATVLAALDARRGQVYAQAFAASDLAPLTGARALAPAEAALGLPRPLVLVGSGAALVRAGLRAAESDDSGVVVHDAILDAAGVAARAAARLAAGCSPGAGSGLIPLYLRPPDARPQTPVVVGPRSGAALSVGGA